MLVIEIGEEPSDATDTDVHPETVDKSGRDGTVLRLHQNTHPVEKAGHPCVPSDDTCVWMSRYMFATGAPSLICLDLFSRASH